METISLSDFRRNLDEIVQRAALGHERIILTSNGDVIAAIVGIEDLERIQAAEQVDRRQEYMRQQLATLDDARLFREQLKAQSIYTDSTETLQEVREDRANDIAGLR